MAFWGRRLKHGREHILSPDETRGRRLRVTLASLGKGKSKKKSRLQCSVGNKRPIVICVLKSNVSDTCHMEIEFEEDDKVTFLVLGERNIHLSGYFIGSSSKYPDRNGEDIPQAEDKHKSDFVGPVDSDMMSASKKRKHDANGDASQTSKDNKEKHHKVESLQDNNDVIVSKEESKELDVEVPQRKLRRFTNGMVVEELAIGRRHNAVASVGKEVSVQYTWWDDNGIAFYRCEEPYHFVLGDGALISGWKVPWDVAVQGMHVGDLRKITIPRKSCSAGKYSARTSQNKFMFHVQLVSVSDITNIH